MGISLQLDNDGDVTLDQTKSFILIDSTEELSQKIFITLSIRKSEWFLNTSFGVPWFVMFEEKYTDAEIISELETIILNIEDVETVDSVEIDRNRATRTATITIKATGNAEETVTVEVTV